MCSVDRICHFILMDQGLTNMKVQSTCWFVPKQQESTDVECDFLWSLEIKKRNFQAEKTK